MYLLVPIQYVIWFVYCMLCLITYLMFCTARFQRGQTWPERMFHAHITLFKISNNVVKNRHIATTRISVITKKKGLMGNQKTSTSALQKLLANLYLSWDLFSRQWHIAAAGMLQSLLCCVGAKGIAVVTGTTFSFRKRRRLIQHLTK